VIRRLDEIVTAAKRSELCVMAVAVAQDDDVLTAVAAAAKEGIIRPILVGCKEKILEIASQINIDVSAFEIVDEPDKEKACMAAAGLVRDKKASLMMKGFVDTSYVMKAVLNKENNLKQSGMITHVAGMEVPGFDRLFYVTVSAMTIAPTLENKVAIINNAVRIGHVLGNECPKVAALCAVEKVNEKMPCTLDAKTLTEMNRRGEITGCVVSGPLAMDNAVSPAAAKHKGIDDPVAGNADVLLVPDIEAGNILNKSMEYFANAKKASVMVGARGPIVLTSRASSAESKTYSIALGALIASSERGRA